ncbi:beta-ketoacyl synthase chain length factor [Cupriavidus agavae]|uniref:Beta-ketoacyl synthase-like protein n=1 Tax=Cupriavidus agavae TaxID=1001822 RepID=A0A4V2FH75_9BURK|nr:beta-ketoacyl synthase chain length factor [Cupriavidus agavae]RZT39299.1 beta-ketoacyl synthase-like protein [Cupriavidus agavae]
MEFGIRAWAAIAPALHTPDQWQAWCRAPWLPDGVGQPEGAGLPALAAMAPMLRRRVNAIGKAALHPAYAVMASASAAAAGGAPPSHTPSVFASRHGDTHRAFEMLSELAGGEPLSPTAFGLSVHNAIGAMFTIDRGDAANLQAVAAGRDTVETAVVEACALLADGADEVLLVCYDAPLPDAYAEFADEPGCLFGWAWLIGRPRAGEATLTLDLVAPRTAKDADTAHPELPHGLDVLRFVLAGEPALTHRGERAIWRWQRHG